MNIKKQETEIWKGSHTGIDFEINHYIMEGLDTSQDCWTYYLIIRLDRIPDKIKSASLWIDGEPDEKGRVYYKYYDNEIICNIDFHSGCTWYSKEYGFDGANKIIKIGCDYQHYWDEGKIYNIDYIQMDVEEAIDSFREIIPDYKYWCRGNGGLFDLNEGVLKDGNFTSNEWRQNEKR